MDFKILLNLKRYHTMNFSIFFSRDILGQPRAFFEKVPGTILEKVPVKIVVLNVQNTYTLMSARDIFSKKCPWHARNSSQKSARDTEKVPVTNFKKKIIN